MAAGVRSINCWIIGSASDPKKAARCHRIEVTALDVLHQVVAVLALDGDREPGPVPRPQIASVARHRPDGHDVIEWREFEYAALKNVHAEILRVPVRGCEHPEQNLRLHK